MEGLAHGECGITELTIDHRIKWYHTKFTHDIGSTIRKILIIVLADPDSDLKDKIYMPKRGFASCEAPHDHGSTK